MKNAIELPVPVLSCPRWRIRYRPETFQPDKVQTLRELGEIVDRNRVRLRGWDFPHRSHRVEEQGRGSNWIASWSSFGGHFEYWRFYQSTQFLYLGSVREVTDDGWHQKLRSEFGAHLSYRTDLDVATIPGFFSIENLIYTVTEYFEFAARLCQAEIYGGTLELTIQLHGIQGFALTTGLDRAWMHVYQATEDELTKSWKISTSDLVAASSELSMNAIVWFFERLGWVDCNRGGLREDQAKFLAGRR